MTELEQELINLMTEAWVVAGGGSPYFTRSQIADRPPKFEVFLTLAAKRIIEAGYKSPEEVIKVNSAPGIANFIERKSLDIIARANGYRLPPTGKAPLLTDEKIEQVVKEWTFANYSVRSIQLDRGHWEYIAPVIAKAQNDADHKFYTEGKE